MLAKRPRKRVVYKLLDDVLLLDTPAGAVSAVDHANNARISVAQIVSAVLEISDRPWIEAAQAAPLGEIGLDAHGDPSSAYVNMTPIAK